jgi:endonuclease/exonuclease/phosphatase family metal-dependent hydrolase
MHFQDAQSLTTIKPRPTFPSRFPLLRIDHVFVSQEIRVTSSSIVFDPLARRASDHLPLLVGFRIE